MTIAQIIVASASASTGPQHSENGVYIWDGRDYNGSNFISSSSTGYPLTVVGGYTGNPTVGNGSWGGSVNSYWMNYDNNGSTNNYGFQTANLNQYGNWKINHLNDPSFTFQIWFYPTTLGTSLVGMNENGAGPFLNNMLEINTDGHLYAQLWENGQSGSPLISTTAAIQNTWNHAFLQYNASGQTLTLSVNNDTPAVLTSFTPVVLPTNNNMAFLLGQNTGNKMTTNGDLSFRGRIAYVKVSNTFVSSDFIDQRSWFYNAFTPPVYGNGSVGGSMYFNGTSSYLQVPITSTGLRFAPGTSDYTIEWWQFMNAAGSYPYVFSISNPDTGAMQLSAFIQSGNLYISDTDHTNVSFGTIPVTTQWTHVAIVRKNNYMSVYVNGISINDPAIYNWPTNIANLGPSGAKFTIGAQADQGGVMRSGTYFSGLITNFNFINGLAKYTSGFVPSTLPFTVEAGVVTKMLLLATTEANVIYDTAASHNVLSNNSVLWSNASPYVVPYLWLDAGNNTSWTGDGTWHDLGYGGHDATFPNSVTYSASNGGILQFASASNQYAELPDLGTMTRFTINIWTKLTSAPPGTFPCFFTEKFSNGVINYVLGFPTNPAEIAGGFFNGGWQTAGATPPITGQWFNFTVTYDGSVIRFYASGGLNSYTNFSGTPAGNGTGSYIGHRWDQLETIDGAIPVVQLYNYALSAAEVSALYNKFSPRY
jgi:hypothetical protein